MNWEIIYKVGITGAGGFVGYLFGGWSVLLQVLITFIIIDQILGWIASYVKGELSSKVGFKGIAKKLAILLVVAVAHLIDELFDTGQTIRDAVIFFYIGNELLSFIENAGRMGIPLPSQLVNAVAILKGKGDEK
jgi:toxin secretion/phage lysis holin